MLWLYKSIIYKDTQLQGNWEMCFYKSAANWLAFVDLVPMM